MDRRLRSAPRGLIPAALLAVPAGVLAIFFAWPLALTLRAAFEGGGAWEWALGGAFVRSRLRVAFLQAILSVAVAMTLAALVAWAHHRRAIPFSRGLLAIHAAPFVLPVFVVVFGIQATFGRGGLVHEVTGLDLLGAGGPLLAVVFANAYYNYGFAARLLHASLERRPRRLEDAARALGAPPRGAFLRVTLPLLLPSILAASLLVFVFSFTSFGVVLYMGSGEVDTLDTLLYENMGGAFPRYDRAAVLGILQIAINLLLLAAYVALRRRAAGVPRDPPRRAPAASLPAALAAGALALLALVPAVSVLLGGFRVRGEWSLEPLRAALDPDHAAHLGGFSLASALANSATYAAATVVASLVLVALVAYGARSARGPLRAAVEVAASLPLGVSSLLLGFGYVVAFGAGAVLDLRGSLLVIVLAHTLVAFPFAARILLPALAEHDARLDEAAALLGASPGSIARRIHLPLLKGPLLAAAGMAAAVSLGDFGASLVLMRPDNMSLSVWIDRHGGLSTFDPLLRAQSHLLAAILMACAAAAYVIVERFRGAEDA